MKLAWPGDAVQETSAASDPQSKGDAASSVNGVEGHVRSIKLAVESAAGVEVPADHDLLSWLVPQATSVHRFGFRSVEMVAHRSSLGTVR